MIKARKLYYLSDIKDALKDSSWLEVLEKRFEHVEPEIVFDLAGWEDLLLENVDNTFCSDALNLVRHLYSLGIDREDSLIYVDV